MSANRSPAPELLWRARLRLAGLSLLVMGGILYGAGMAMARLLLQEQEAALRNKANLEVFLHGVRPCERREKAASHAQQDANWMQRYLKEPRWQ